MAGMDEQGLEDAAILLMSMGEEEAAEVFKHLSPKEVQRLGETIAKMKAVSRERYESVIDKFITVAQADYMGMIATVMNGLALQDALERVGQYSRVMTAVEMPKVAEPYIRRRCERHLEKGRIVILAGGTGNPFFTTDTAAALRAAEIEAKAILKGTHSGVDGIYTADPKLDKNATRYKHLTHLEVINKGLRVMDSTAITFCMDNKLPIVVFNLLQKGNLRAILQGDEIGTLVA